MTGWAETQIQALSKPIKTAATSVDAVAAITATPKFRGYYARWRGV